jgi:peptidoglycan hydrolase-like protein with peptidoglycan-binding domain
MDEMVLNTQKWLNATYAGVSGYNEVTENGQTGWPTIYALTRALQIELGIAIPADSFGPATQAAYAANPLVPSSGTNNKFAILQGALWCKGYDPGHYASENGVEFIDDHFDSSVASAVLSLKTDAGIVTTDATVTVNFMKALLSMDAFKLINWNGVVGDTDIRAFQQYMNATYQDYIGIMPCDGLYGRNTNKALIYALQAEEGLPISVANGNFGNTTKSCCPTIPYTNGQTNYSGSLYNSSQIANFTKLLKFGLYVNGFGNGTFSGSVSSSVISEFQAHNALTVTGIANLTTWMSVMISSGDTSRSALGADCATILTAAKAQSLVNSGYQIIGRYLTGVLAGGISKALTESEISLIFDAGLKFFPIFQTSGRSAAYFTASQGTADAAAAVTAANGFRIPYQSIIYFAVDFDAMDYHIDDNILPYFESIANYFENTSHKYRVGIYGARNVCSRVANAGYSVSSFVGDMSTGFSGNLGFKIPDDWAFDQFATVTIGSGAGTLEIDKDGYSGKDTGVSYRFAAPLSGGAGAGIAMVNRSGQNMKVFADREWLSPPGVWYPVGDPIDVIPHNGFFVYKHHGTPPNEPWTQRCLRVLYTNSNGVPAEGYVYEGGNLFSTDQEYEEVWAGASDFMNFKCNALNTDLVDATAENINGAWCTIYTLSNYTYVFTSPDGDYVGTLPAGTQIGISGSTCGNSRPYLLYVQRIYNANSEQWETFNNFIDLRFDLGNMPSNRLLR